MRNGFEVYDRMRNGKEYNGATHSFGISVGGLDYIVKCDLRNAESGKMEYMAQHMYGAMGIEVQKVWIGKYRDKDAAIIKRIDGLGETNFLSKDDEIDYTMEDVKKRIPSKENLDDKLYRIFIADFLFMNYDRKTSAITVHRSEGGFTVGKIIDNEGIFGHGTLKNEYFRIAKKSSEKTALQLTEYMISSHKTMLDLPSCKNIVEVSNMINGSESGRMVVSKIQLGDILNSTIESGRQAGISDAEIRMMCGVITSRMHALEGMELEKIADHTMKGLNHLL